MRANAKSRSAGPFDVETLPAGLRGDHRIAEGRWGRLRVIKGSVGFQFADAATVIHLRTGDEQAIPPAVAHRLVPEGPMEIVIEFLGRE